MKEAWIVNAEKILGEGANVDYYGVYLKGHIYWSKFVSGDPNYRFSSWDMIVENLERGVVLRYQSTYLD